jgi:hypothetical protein
MGPVRHPVLDLDLPWTLILPLDLDLLSWTLTLPLGKAAPWEHPGGAARDEELTWPGGADGGLASG